MTALVALVLGVAVAPAKAPVPREARQDPMGKGYMGLWVSNNGLTIDRCEPNMPADRAGLRGGDTFVRVGTLTPANFEQVTAHVMSFRPGAIIEIEVQRGEQRKTFKVKLGTRPPDLERSAPYPIEFDPIDP
jgi:S1-C subfamily serine protease